MAWLNLAGAGGIEPPTSCLEGRRSIRLSYAPSDWSQRMIQARAASVKGGVNLDHFGGAKVDQLVKG